MAKLVGQDAKTGKFTPEALQQDIRDLKQGRKKVVVTKQEHASASPSAPEHQWEPDFSNGECIGCRTCGICGATHQSAIEDAELIDRQYLQICVLKADQDIAAEHTRQLEQRLKGLVESGAKILGKFRGHIMPKHDLAVHEFEAALAAAQKE